MENENDRLISALSNYLEANRKMMFDINLTKAFSEDLCNRQMDKFNKLNGATSALISTIRESLTKTEENKYVDN